MASSPTSSTQSTSDSDNSTTQTPSHPVIANENGAHDMLQKKTEAGAIDPFKDMNSKEYIGKFKKYEADYTRRLKAKYFSDKNIYGGNIFDVKLTIDGENIKASRWPGYQSYADPASFLAEQSSNGSTSASEASNDSNGKH
ncbi:unnamed protein product [Ilex paraguariensis]|uniref:Uncharacterized protein n=1 Tax=Ilex paraguariensis TaxID=185542 RepID=A0ABC8RSI4_9AQUA